MVLLELLGEATAGVLVEELLKKVPELGRRVTEFKDAAERLEKTLLYIYPLIQDIEHHSHALERQPGVLQTLVDFRESLEKGQEFVGRCLKVGRWKFWKKIRCKKGLDELDKSLRSFKEYMLFLMARDARETLRVVRSIHLSLPDCTKLTVSIVEEKQVRVLMVEFRDPTYTRSPICSILLGHGSTGWCSWARFEICMGQTQITLDHKLMIVRRNSYSGESNGYRIDLDSSVFNGHMIKFSSAAMFPTVFLEGILVDPKKYPYDWYWMQRNDGSIRQHTLYEGLAWGGNLQEQSIPMSLATISLSWEGLRSSLPWIPSYTIPSSIPSSRELIAASEIQNKLCYCGRRAALRRPNSESSSRSFYNCEEGKCGYFEFYPPMENETSTAEEVASHDNSYAPMEIETSVEVASHGNSYVPMENETSGAGIVASHDNSYTPMENETSAARKVVSHDGSINSDSKEKENDDIEAMSRKCLKKQLHVLQGTINGQKLLITTCVMVCFLSLIMNFVILMYK